MRERIVFEKICVMIIKIYIIFVSVILVFYESIKLNDMTTQII